MRKKRKISTHGKTQSRNKLEIPSDDPAVCLNCRKVRCSGERNCYLERKREAENSCAGNQERKGTG